MRPEDIDKLFNKRLGNSAPTPPADLWSRLQDRIEEELPAPQKEEKRRYLWLYQAAAAVVAVLLTVSILLNNTKQAPGTSAPIAQQQPATPAAQPAPAQTQPTAPALADNSVPAEVILEQEAGKAAEASKVSGDAIAKASPRAKENRTAAKRKITRPSDVSGSMLATSGKPKEPVRNTVAPEPAVVAALPETPVVLAAATSNANLNAQPVEITFKFASASAEQPAPQEEAASDLKKKGRLAKNIFQQVRNLSNGERVELSALGIKADKIALETQIGKQKLSKVINL